MANKSKWPNEEMWREVVTWRKGGVSFGNIVGRLAIPENMRKYGLEEIPSEETVRRQFHNRLSSQPAPVQTRTNHIANMNWLCEQLLTEVHMPVLQVLRSLEKDPASATFWSANGWTPKPESPVDVNWAVSINRADTPPSISLVVEGFPAYEHLKQHLSTSPVWQYLLDWKRQIATAVGISMELNVELRSMIEPSVKRWILPEELTSTTDGVLHNFTESIVAAAFQRGMDNPAALPCYVIEASPHHPTHQHVFQLLWQGDTNWSIVLAISGERRVLDELRSSHQAAVKKLINRDELVLINRAYNQATYFQEYIKEVLDRVLNQDLFPGNCSVCRGGLD